MISPEQPPLSSEHRLAHAIVIIAPIRSPVLNDECTGRETPYRDQLPGGLLIIPQLLFSSHRLVQTILTSSCSLQRLRSVRRRAEFRPTPPFAISLPPPRGRSSSSPPASCSQEQPPTSSCFFCGDSDPRGDVLNFSPMRMRSPYFPRVSRSSSSPPASCSAATRSSPRTRPPS